MDMVDNQQYLLNLFKQTGALLDGHFQLTSGLHSSRYLQCALVLQYPEHADYIGRTLAAKFRDDRVDLVVAPAIGGIIVAHETARAIGVRALFTEREAGVMTLRRGFRLSQGERVLVVEDVVTTGGSTRETIQAVIDAMVW
jgi:orotate phosphoribosyltransferase